ncbi:hypothetical protein QQ045_000225 [Rhodiola kirilowii]
MLFEDKVLHFKHTLLKIIVWRWSLINVSNFLFLYIQWVVQGAVDVDIGANPSAEGGGDDEGVDDQAVKVVDIVDTFRLQEQPAFDKKQFVTYIKRYIKLLTPKLEGEKQDEFKKNIEGATKFLLSKLSDLQYFVGESMHDDASLVFAYYKDGAADPTFLYFGHGLKEIKC